MLDENLPHDLRHFLTGHEVVTVAYMNRHGVSNGLLLEHAGTARFDAVITMDAGLEYEQNLAALPVSVVLLSCPDNTLQSLMRLVPALLKALDILKPRTLVRVP